MARAQHLAIWMNGLPVGYWERQKGEDLLSYLPQWTTERQGRPLSLSLPFTPDNQVHRGSKVRDFFDNLLPDSEGIRRRLAVRYHAESLAPFDLLAELGRDCVGAIQLLPRDRQPEHIDSIQQRPLSEAEIAMMLRSTAGLVGNNHHDDLRLSIAGAQEKTALLWHNQRWCLPEGSTPTTHILKLPLGLVGNMQADMRTSVENEWLCARIVSEYGLPVAATTMSQFEDQKVLVVERFDRQLASDGRWWLRLPQEDMCQACGVSPLRKYQSDGGPGIRDIMTILNRSERSQHDRLQFFKTQIIFWLLAATDGHAKNFSIAHLPGGRYQLTPLYDILSAYPVTGPGNHQVAWQKCKLAMAVHGTSNYYLINRIQRRHWITQGEQTGLSRQQVEQMIEEIVTTTEDVIRRTERLLPQDFPAEVADSIFNGMRKQCARFG